MRAERAVPFGPPIGQSRSSPFAADDPFGLRKAVLPVFERDPSGTLTGMGTAFHVDGWGGCLTAEHVVDFMRAGISLGNEVTDFVRGLDPLTRSHPVVMLGLGLVYGKVAIPAWALAPIAEAGAVIGARDDPLADLRGEATNEIALDLAGLVAHVGPETLDPARDRVRTVPVQLTAWTPTVGEHVLAFGYPALRPSTRVSESTLRTLVEDGLFGAYGKITRLFPAGRDAVNKTPVFEVEADWPSGMSGGPIFNETGNVIGVVSRSLAPDGETPGVGYGACLPWVPEARRLAPRVDPDTPGWRLGYGVRIGPGLLHSFWPIEQMAGDAAAGINDSSVVLTSKRIGSDDFIFQA